MFYEEVFKALNKNKVMDMPVCSKLEWLEEMNSFVYKALSKRKIKVWERIKKGDA